MKKIDFYDIIWIICIYLLCASLPFGLFIKNDKICLLLTSISLVAFLIFIFYYMKKNKLNEFPFFNKFNKKFLYCIPFYLICFCNIIYLLIFKISLNEFDLSLFIIEIFHYLLVSISEEIIFRYLVLNNQLKSQSIFKTIIYSSLYFSLMHIANIFSEISLSNLLFTIAQIGYTFAIGLVLAIIYILSKNIIMPIIFHFLFNLFNDTLFTMFYSFEKISIEYIIFILVFILIYSVYGLIIYKKEVKNYAR